MAAWPCRLHRAGRGPGRAHTRSCLLLRTRGHGEGGNSRAQACVRVRLGQQAPRFGTTEAHRLSQERDLSGSQGPVGRPGRETTRGSGHGSRSLLAHAQPPGGPQEGLTRQPWFLRGGGLFSGFLEQHLPLVPTSAGAERAGAPAVQAPWERWARQLARHRRGPSARGAGQGPGWCTPIHQVPVGSPPHLHLPGGQGGWVTGPYLLPVSPVQGQGPPHLSHRCSQPVSTDLPREPGNHRGRPLARTRVPTLCARTTETNTDPAPTVSTCRHPPALKPQELDGAGLT